MRSCHLSAAFWAAFLLAASTPLQADPWRPGAFLVEELGARHLALGGATSALLDDVSALYANPAGLTGVDQYQGILGVGNTHSRDLVASFALAAPFQRRSTFALGVSGFKASPGEAAVRLGHDGHYHPAAASLSEVQGIVDLGVGRSIGRGLSLGAAARYARTDGTAGERDYEGLYGNVGLRYNSAFKGIVAGLVVRNIGGRLDGAPEPDVPVTVAAGFSYGRLHSTVHYYNLSVEAVRPEGMDLSVRAGAEYWWANYLGLRVGYDGLAGNRDGNRYDGRWRGGLSVAFRGLMFDFAAVPARTKFSDTRLEGSLRFFFGEERRR